MWWLRRDRFAKSLGLELIHPQKRYARLLQRYVEPETEWLDVGCGRQLLPSWALPNDDQATLARTARQIVGMDLDDGMKANESLTHRVWGRGEGIPFADGAFSLVTANMVVEHLDEPLGVLREIHRVLRSGGRFIFLTVNKRSVMAVAGILGDELKGRLAGALENRKPEDVFPTRYKMNSVKDTQRLAAEAGFGVEVLETLNTPYFVGTPGPWSMFELTLTRIVQTPVLARYGTNLLVSLKKA